ncbi:MAG: HD domain-containing protein, partial [Muribaculaceae bacterium]|nr:HD domain-containing protein [Muribaculaceae bacterium]
GWRLLSDTGLLDLILPELAALKGVEVVKGLGHKDNFDHTMKVLDNVASKSDKLWLRWGALLHDIAKPVTKRFEEGVGWTFHNHNYIGARMVERIFKKLKLPLDERMRYVAKIVELHMRPIALVEEEVTDSAIRRLIYEAGDDIDDLMTLCKADITSKNQERVRRHLVNFELVQQKMVDLNERDRIRNFQPPIDGNEIMDTFGLRDLPSSELHIIGDIKKSIKDAILDGLIPNEHDAAREWMLARGAEMGLTPRQ